MTVCFFGHRDTPQSIKPKLYDLLVDLIENQTADSFFVGNQGNFDAMVRDILRNLQKRYPHITYAVVLAYLPTEKPSLSVEDYSDTTYPEEVAQAPKRFAIDRRNRWMIEQSDTAVCYVTHSLGGAAKYRTAAQKAGLRVMDLGE